jgi:hypothetical protein
MPRALWPPRVFCDANTPQASAILNCRCSAVSNADNRAPHDPPWIVRKPSCVQLGSQAYQRCHEVRSIGVRSVWNRLRRKYYFRLLRTRAAPCVARAAVRPCAHVQFHQGPTGHPRPRRGDARPHGQPPMLPGVFPDYSAPMVRTAADGVRETRHGALGHAVAGLRHRRQEDRFWRHQPSATSNRPPQVRGMPVTFPSYRYRVGIDRRVRTTSRSKSRAMR